MPSSWKSGRCESDREAAVCGRLVIRLSSKLPQEAGQGMRAAYDEKELLRASSPAAESEAAWQRRCVSQSCHKPRHVEIGSSLILMERPSI